MTNPPSAPEPSKPGFRVTVMQGVIGAVSLAGTTAIPLLVQRVLTPPTSPPSTAGSPSAQVQAAPASPVASVIPALSSTSTTVTAPELSSPKEQSEDGKGRGKKRNQKRD